MPWYGFTQYGAPDIPEFESTVETGSIFLFPSAGALDEDGIAVINAPPFGFLRCDGAAVPIINYQDLYDLFVASGVSFGAAPVGQFRLPNFQGRFPIGLNTGDPSCDIIGEVGGANSHTHTVPDGSHTHGTTAHTHAVSNHGHLYDNNHIHTMDAHTHSKGSLFIPDANNPTGLYSGSSFSVAAFNHGHAFSASSSDSAGGTGVSDPKKTVSGNWTINRDSTDNMHDSGYTPSTSSQADTASGAPSAATALSTSGGTDNIPPYYSLYFVIKT